MLDIPAASHRRRFKVANEVVVNDPSKLETTGGQRWEPLYFCLTEKFVFRTGAQREIQEMLGGVFFNNGVYSLSGNLASWDIRNFDFKILMQEEFQLGLRAKGRSASSVPITMLLLGTNSLRIP